MAFFHMPTPPGASRVGLGYFHVPKTPREIADMPLPARLRLIRMGDSLRRIVELCMDGSLQSPEVLLLIHEEALKGLNITRGGLK